MKKSSSGSPNVEQVKDCYYRRTTGAVEDESKVSEIVLEWELIVGDDASELRSPFRSHDHHRHHWLILPMRTTTTDFDQDVGQQGTCADFVGFPLEFDEDRASWSAKERLERGTSEHAPDASETTHQRPVESAKSPSHCLWDTRRTEFKRPRYTSRDGCHVPSELVFEVSAVLVDLRQLNHHRRWLSNWQHCGTSVRDVLEWNYWWSSNPYHWPDVTLGHVLSPIREQQLHGALFHPITSLVHKQCAVYLDWDIWSRESASMSFVFHREWHSPS